MRLTGPAIAKLQLPDGKSELIVFDEVLPGFGIRIRAGGKRVWVAQYRVGTKQRRVTIGNVEVLSIDHARQAAKDILAKVQLGSDPQVAKQSERKKAAVTFGSVAKLYLGEAEKRLKPRSFEEVQRHLTQHWRPLKETPLHHVERADVAARLRVVAKENGPFAANRARSSLSAFFTWAMREGIVNANPVISTNRATDEISRDRVLSDREIALVWANAGDGDYGRIVRLLLLTGQRREEVGGIAWDEVDTSKRLWGIPKERTKNGLPHDVPLSDAAYEILASTPRRDERALLFGEGQGAYSGWSKSKASLDRRIAKQLAEQDDNQIAVPPWRLHDLRRTAATKMHDLGVLPHVVEAVLNHVSGHRAGVAGVYNRSVYAAEKRAALDVWGAFLLNVTGSGLE